jgi:hypothetical protein
VIVSRDVWPLSYASPVIRFMEKKVIVDTQGNSRLIGATPATRARLHGSLVSKGDDVATGIVRANMTSAPQIGPFE